MIPFLCHVVSLFNICYWKLDPRSLIEFRFVFGGGCRCYWQSAAFRLSDFHPGVVNLFSTYKRLMLTLHQYLITASEGRLNGSVSFKDRVSSYIALAVLSM